MAPYREGPLHPATWQARLDVALKAEDYETVARLQPLVAHAIRTLHDLETQPPTPEKAPQEGQTARKVAAEELLTVDELSTELAGMGFRETEISQALPACLAAAATAAGPMCVEDIVAMMLDPGHQPPLVLEGQDQARNREAWGARAARLHDLPIEPTAPLAPICTGLAPASARARGLFKRGSLKNRPGPMAGCLQA
jgi:hypothetical protein